VSLSYVYNGKPLNIVALLPNLMTETTSCSGRYAIHAVEGHHPKITETLIPSSVSQESKPLQFGKYKGNRISTLEDFTIAEWRPTDRELNGG
jgi:hypothetical protein